MDRHNVGYELKKLDKLLDLPIERFLENLDVRYDALSTPKKAELTDCVYKLRRQRVIHV